MLEVLADDRALMYWFTYDEQGNQRWLTGLGEIDGDTIFFSEVIVTHGGRFGPDFDPDEVVREFVGQVTFRFDDCSNGVVEFQAFGQAGAIPVQRLSRTMAVECPPITGRPVRTAGALSGSWFDPAHSGEGFALQWLDRDEAVVTWFTYDAEGNQFWMIGVGQADEAGRLVIPDLAATRGGRFGAAFDSDDVELFEWGALVLDLSCAGGPADYDSVFPEFGSGSQQLVRLTRLNGLDCPLFMPALGALSDAEWDQRFTIAGVSGTFVANKPQVLDFEHLADGTMVAAGQFGWLGQRMVPPVLQRVSPSGDWEPLPAALDLETEAVTALAHDPEHGLALAAAFPLFQVLLINGTEVRPIATFDGFVRRLVWFDDRLWAAGLFALEESEATNLAVWDGSQWRAPAGGVPDDVVYALHVDDDALYVGGQFQTVGGIQSRGVARFDGASWQAFDLPGRVYSIETTGDELFAAGAIGMGGVVQWTGEEWVPLGSGLANRGGSGVVSDIHRFGDALYAIGCFGFANGPPGSPDSVPARGIASWDGERWRSPDQGEKPVGSVFFSIFLVCGDEPNPFVAKYLEWQRLASDGEHLYIGGGFPGISGTASQGLMVSDGEDFFAQGRAEAGLSGAAASLAVGGPDDTLYAFGPSHFGGASVASRLARFDPDAGWEPVGPPLPADFSCAGSGGGVVVDGRGTVYVGCTDFSADPGRTDPTVWRARVLRLDGGAWADVGKARDFRPLSTIALGPDGAVWIAGGMLSGDLREGYIARLEDSRFVPFEDGFDGPVSQLAFAPDRAGDSGFRLVAGGTFTRIDAQSFSYIVHWNGQRWEALGEGLQSVPMAVEYGSDRIFASVSPGAEADEAQRLVLGAWDGERWAELATPDSGFPMVEGAQFFALKQAGSRLYAAGSVPIEQIGSDVFVFENGRFSLVGGGVVGNPDTIAIRHDGIYFGGQIAEADPDGKPVSSVGIARLFWP